MISTTKIKPKRMGERKKGKKERKKDAETHIKKFFSKLSIKFSFLFLPERGGRNVG